MVQPGGTEDEGGEGKNQDGTARDTQDFSSFPPRCFPVHPRWEWAAFLPESPSIPRPTWLQPR